MFDRNRGTVKNNPKSLLKEQGVSMGLEIYGNKVCRFCGGV